MRTTRTVIPAAVLALLVSRVTFGQPTITSISPETGKVGGTVTITGTGFDATPANNKVYFGAVSAPVLSASVTSLRLNSPAQATFSHVSVTTGNLTEYSRRPFIVTFNPNATVTTGSFGNRENFPIGGGPEHTAIADFDGDGRPDMATICFASNKMYSFVNTSTVGIVNFRTVQDDGIGPRVDSTEVLPQEIAAADIDGDGKLDIIVANFDTTTARKSTISVFRNTSTVGNISFATRVNDSVGVSPAGLAVADIDGDGKPDIVTANEVSGDISFIRNTSTPGNITFGTTSTTVRGGLPHTVAIGDLDGDGKPDIAVTNTDIREISVYPNKSTTGNIAFDNPTSVSFYVGTTQVAESLAVPLFVALGDIDGDGKADLVATDTTQVAPKVFILRNTSSGVGNFSFASPVKLTRGNGFGAPTIADITGDGRPDIVVGNSRR